MKKLLETLENPPGPLRRRDFLGLALGATLVPAWLAACGRGTRERVVNLFSWSNYIGKKTIPGFEAETGIKVNLEPYSDEEDMFAKLRTGVQGYDLIVVDDFMIPKLKALDLIDAYPAGELKNLGNVDPKFSDPAYDPGLRFTVPYLFGTTGIGANRKYVKDMPSTWKDLWDERYKGKLTMLDNARDAIGAALFVLGLPVETEDPARLKKAKDLLIKQKPLLKHYTSSTYIDELTAGEAWISQGWSGDVLQAARENPDIDYAVPREGSFLWVSSLCLVKGSRHREETLAFVDHILRPDVHAEISNTMRYACPNAAARPQLDPALLNDKRVFPDEGTFKRLRFNAALSPEGEALWSRTWVEVKTA